MTVPEKKIYYFRYILIVRWMYKINGFPKIENHGDQNYLMIRIVYINYLCCNLRRLHMQPPTEMT